MRQTQLHKRKYVLAIGSFMLIAGFVIEILFLVGQIILYQKNVVGKLYLKNQEQCRMYLYTLFEPMSEENIHASEVAFCELGFSEKGAWYVMQTMGIKQYLIPMLCFIVVLCVGLIWCLYDWHKTYQIEIEILEKTIRNLEYQKTKEEYLAEQNKKIQRFIENIAHQVKTPVSRVVASLDMIELQLKEPMYQLRIEECYEHLDSIRLLMKKLTDIGRLEAGQVLFQKEKIYLEELFKDVVKSQLQDMKRVNLIQIPKDEIMQFHGDYEWLKEAFSNLLKNALEHDNSGKPIEITLVKKEEYYSIMIRDYGTGIMEQDIPNLFDRFYMPQNVKVNHTGIGLNLAKLIFEGHFGSIHAYNHEEGGAVFQILLPIYALK